MNYYAVKSGRRPGIYNTWDECKREVHGYKGAIYKKFSTLEDALSFIQGEDLQAPELDLQMGENDYIAYVDGSFRQKDRTYSYGVYITNGKQEWTFSKRFYHEDATMRNVSGEIEGAMKAMEEVRQRKGKRLHLHYDYEGIRSWALGYWKTNREGTKQYKSFYDEIKGELEVDFIKVKAHSGVKYNELVDQLAKEAI